MCILLSLLMFLGKLLTKVTPEKSPHSEYSDKNRMSAALAETPELIAGSSEGLHTRSLPGGGSALGAVRVSRFLNAVWFVFSFYFVIAVLALSGIFFGDLVFGLGFVCGNRI